MKAIVKPVFDVPMKTRLGNQPPDNINSKKVGCGDSDRRKGQLIEYVRETKDDREERLKTKYPDYVRDTENDRKHTLTILKSKYTNSELSEAVPASDIIYGEDLVDNGEDLIANREDFIPNLIPNRRQMLTMSYDGSTSTSSPNQADVYLSEILPPKPFDLGVDFDSVSELGGSGLLQVQADENHYWREDFIAPKEIANLGVDSVSKLGSLGTLAIQFDDNIDFHIDLIAPSKIVNLEVDCVNELDGLDTLKMQVDHNMKCQKDFIVSNEITGLVSSFEVSTADILCSGENMSSSVSPIAKDVVFGVIGSCYSIGSGFVIVFCSAIIFSTGSWVGHTFVVPWLSSKLSKFLPKKP